MFVSRIVNSGLVKTSILKGRNASKQKKKTSATLMLTSLIDAFSILVIYLLMFFSSTGEMMYVNAEINLPKATTLERLDRHSIIQVRQEGYFVEDQKIEKSKLNSFLVSLKKSLSSSSNTDSNRTITIQADKKIKYSQLSSIIQACSHAGFSEIKFAVLGE